METVVMACVLFVIVTLGVGLVFTCGMLWYAIWQVVADLWYNR